MAIKTFVKNLIALIGKKRRQKREVKFKFCRYKGEARMLAVALEEGLKNWDDFLENRDYISSLTQIFNKDSYSYRGQVHSLCESGLTEQLKSVLKVGFHDYYLQTLENMTTYIKSLWDLFHTPDPE
jgi:hypothetical protein